MRSWPYKDPDEVLDYQVDWTDRLAAGEHIASSTFLLKAGSVTLGTHSDSAGVTTVWISGGTEGEVCLVTNRIVTDNTPARTYDETVRLRIRSK